MVVMDNERQAQPLASEQGRIDSEDRRRIKHLWERAEFIARVDLFNVRVTQVNERGFYACPFGEAVPKFHPWPQSRTARAGENFGVV